MEKNINKLMEVADFFHKKGLYLENVDNIRAQEYAFSLQDAMELISLLRETNNIILGGDILHYNGNELVYSYANWSSELSDFSDITSFIEGSLNIAEKYLKEYPQKDVMVVFVITDALSFLIEKEL